jgi:amino acid transporter
MMAFGTNKSGVANFIGSPALMGDLGRSYVGNWVGDVITLGAAVSAFACCLACVVGAARLLFAITRDLSPTSVLGGTGSAGTPAAATFVVTVIVAAIGLICAVAFSAKPFDTFLWSGTIGTLILLVAYVLATLGCIKLVFVEKKLSVPQWQVVIPILALIVLGYTIYRNVIPYPSVNPGRWLPAVAFGWVLLVTIVVLVVPDLARRLSRGLASADENADALR